LVTLIVYNKQTNRQTDRQDGLLEKREVCSDSICSGAGLFDTVCLVSLLSTDMMWRWRRVGSTPVSIWILF